MEAPRRIEMQITSDTARLAAVRRALEAFAGEAGFSEEGVGQIGLCVNEALANVIRHAYDGNLDKPIHLQAESTHDRGKIMLRLIIRDWGCGKNPAVRIPKLRDPLEPGGVGMICLKQLMDEVVFSPQPDGMLLTMVKRQETDTG